MKLKAQKRDTDETSPKSLRKEGRIPAVVYGHDYDSEAISVDEGDFSSLFREVGKSEIFDLELDSDDYQVLVQDFQLDPVTDEITHADFYRVREDEEISTTVPIVLKGEAPIEERDGVIVTHIRDLKVEALPSDLPAQLNVSLESLEEFEDTIRIKDLDIPEGVKIDRESDNTIVSVSRPKTEEELEELEETPEEVIEDIETVGEEEEEEEELAEIEEAEEEIGEEAEEEEEEIEEIEE